MTRKILIIGATSSIAQAVAKLFALNGDVLCLAGRDINKLDTIAADLRVRGAKMVETVIIDMDNFDSHGEFINQAVKSVSGLDVALIAHGTLPDQTACELSFEQTYQEISVNALSVISLLTLLGRLFAEKRTGMIAVISSVAGERGRQSNYVYGTAKAAVTTFLSGLRNRLYPLGVNVLTIKPGFVDTPMTQEFDKGLLWVSPENVAKDIFKAIKNRKNTIYTPWFWRWIMLIIRIVPERIFVKMKL